MCQQEDVEWCTGCGLSNIKLVLYVHMYIHFWLDIVLAGFVSTLDRIIQKMLLYFTFKYMCSFSADKTTRGQLAPFICSFTKVFVVKL